MASRLAHPLLLLTLTGCAPERAEPVQREPVRSYAPADAPPHPAFPGLDARLVSRGARVDLADHVVKGKITVFDFYADWCEPCLYTDTWLRRWLAEEPVLALRKVDVVSWESPVARQHLAGPSSELPYFVVYDLAGRRLGDVQGGRLRTLRRLLDEAGARAP